MLLSSVKLVFWCITSRSPLHFASLVHRLTPVLAAMSAARESSRNFCGVSGYSGVPYFVAGTTNRMLVAHRWSHTGVRYFRTMRRLTANKSRSTSLTLFVGLISLSLIRLLPPVLCARFFWRNQNSETPFQAALFGSPSAACRPAPSPALQSAWQSRSAIPPAYG